METNKILTADILDIVFDGRNKLYGAYDLRKTYNKRLRKSLLLTASLFLLVLLTSVFAGARKKSNANLINVKEIAMAEVHREEVKPLPPPPVKITPPAPVKQNRFIPPVIVNDDKVDPDEKITDLEDDAVISNKTVESDNTNAKVQAPIEEKATQVIEAPKADDEGTVFTSVQIEAEFPGGSAAWTRYLQKSLDGFNAGENGAAPGKYQVVVRFIVSKDGTISDVTPETSFGYGLEEIAVKCIKKGPNWKPALQNGKNVNAYRRQPITFVVNEE